MTHQRDVLGIIYDRSWTDSDGDVHYERDRAIGGAAGPSRWSTAHDCNPICGCHLAAKCLGCNVCTTCDGCFCGEGGDW